MKKKTVITTEKHEVWVIRQPSGEASSGDVIEQDANNARSSSNSIAIPNGEVVEIPLTPKQNLEPE